MARGNGIDRTSGDGDGLGRPFRPRLSRARGENPRSFISKINKAVAKARAASGKKRGARPSGRFNARGRGAKVAPGLKGRGGWQLDRGMRFRARRVVVKARVVKLKGSGSQAAAHLRYLQREGAGLEREAAGDRSPERAGASRAASTAELAAGSEEAAKGKEAVELASPAEASLAPEIAAPELAHDTGRADAPFLLAAGSNGAARDGAEIDRSDRTRGALYAAFDNDADARAFIARGAKDRHQFRLIVSAEDGAELGDLRPFTRDLMAGMERDLKTRLDWVAVDHYDTGHPHTHIVVRGATDDGKTLNIAGDYIAHGIRARASERLTLELGRQSELEALRALGREAHQDRFTRLDRELHRLAENSAERVIDLRPGAALEESERLRINKHLLLARAKHLEELGLATRERPGVWALSPDAEEILRRMGERGDIIKGMHRAMRAASIQRPIAESAPASPLVGRLIGKELASDELSGAMRLVIDGADGRVRSVEIGASHAAVEARLGAIIEIGPPSLKAADKNIIDIAKDNAGIYDPQAHAMSLAERRGVDEARDLALAHVRRLEALRRPRVVERRDDGSWRIPEDYAEKALAYEARGAKTTARILSAFTLEAQVASDGATWLDRTLLKGGEPSRANAGFGVEIGRALRERAERLVHDGLAVREDGPAGPMMRYHRNLLATLRARELLRVGEEMAAKSGKAFRFAQDGASVSGTYARAVELVSGRYAVLENSREFTLVPWRPVIEKELGRQVHGIARGLGIDWEMGRKRDLGLSR